MQLGPLPRALEPFAPPQRPGVALLAWPPQYVFELLLLFEPWTKLELELLLAPEH